MRIKTGDTVIVIAGKEKGKSGKVLKTLPKENRVIVEGLNMVTKHKKTQGPNQPGGIQRVEAPIHVSNVMYSENGKGTKLGYKVSGDKKVRVSKATNKEIK